MRAVYFLAFGFVCLVKPSYADGEMPTETTFIGSVAGAGWSGMYLGVSGSRVDFDGKYSSYDLSLSALDTQLSGSAVGHAVELAIGYNWENGSLVYGLEGSISSQSAEINFVEIYQVTESWGYSQSVPTLVSLSGRLGYSFGDTLFYGTAGLASGKVLISGYDTLQPVGGSSSGWSNGFLYGVGIERKFSSSLSTTLEYRNVILDTFTHYPDYWYNDFRDSHELQFHDVSLGIKYHF